MHVVRVHKLDVLQAVGHSNKVLNARLKRLVVRCYAVKVVETNHSVTSGYSQAFTCCHECHRGHPVFTNLNLSLVAESRPGLSRGALALRNWGPFPDFDTPILRSSDVLYHLFVLLSSGSVRRLLA